MTEHRGSLFQRATARVRSRRVVTALAASLSLMSVLAVAGVASGQTGGGNPSGFDVVGELSRLPADARAIFGAAIVPPEFGLVNGQPDPRGKMSGTVISLPEVRQLWQVWEKPSTAGGGTAIAVRNLDTLAIERTLQLDINLAYGSANGAGEFMHAIDPGHRLFLRSNDTVVVIDLATFATRKLPLMSPVPGVAAIGGISYDDDSNALIALAGGPSSFNVANTTTYIARLDLTSGTATQWRVVRSCTGPLPSADAGTTYSMPVLGNADNVYFACQRAGQVGAVVRLPRVSAFNPAGQEEEVVVGPVYIDTALADAGSGRLFLVTTTGEIWAFDTGAMSFVGVVSSHADAKSGVDVGFGVDRGNGRIFFQSPTHGVGIAEGRFFPLPQARTLASATAPGQQRIESDGATSRIFVLTGRKDAKALSYVIYKIDPAPSPPPPPDPDRSTVDREEKDGITESRYAANGRAYGYRVLFANGVSTVPPAPSAGVITPTATVIKTVLTPKCGFSDRELVAGRVVKGEYDSGSSAAQAIAVGVDERSKQDLALPSRCDVESKSANFGGLFGTFPAAADTEGPGWNHEPAVCTESVGGPGKDGVPKDDRQLGKASVHCPSPGGTLTASAFTEMEGGVAVGRAESEVTIKKLDNGKGVQSIATGIAKDINIAGVIHIAEVRSIATSVSNGRPHGDPSSTHTVVMKGVKLGDAFLCTDTCDNEEVVLQLNDATRGRIQFRTKSGLDDRLLQGTPKGALTAVQKSEQRQASDQALVGDFTTEVPGLEMIVYNDNVDWGRARQLYQFAGVSTVSGYSISVIPTFVDDGFADEPLDDELDDVDLDDLGIEAVVDDVSSPDVNASGESGEPIVELTPRPDFPQRVLDAVVDGLRLFFTSPRHAALILTAWGLLGLPVFLSRRRRLLAAARSV